MGMLLGAMLATTFVASPSTAADRAGYRAIAAGDFATAARQIEAERRIFPQRPELMLNLAVAYARMGRSAEASTLYRQVLDRPVVAMDLPDGSVVSSHDIATRGLSRLSTEIATR